VSLILLILVFIFFWKAAILQGIFFVGDKTGNDLMEINYPFKNFLSESLKSFSLPLWTKDIFNGFPIHAEGEGGFFYPLNLILFWILPSWVAFNYSVVLTFFLAGLFTYLYTRSLELSKIGAFMSAVTFMFSGFFVTHLIHLNMINVAMWIPLCFFFVEKYFRTNKFYYGLLVGIIFGMQVLCGFPQLAYYSILATASYFIFRLFCKTSGQKVNIKKQICVLILILTIGIGLSAIQWIPTYEFVRFSSRQKGVTFDYANLAPYRIKDLIMFLRPNYFGSPINATYNQPNSIYGENCAYIGLLSLLLAIIAIIFCRKNRYVKFFTVTIFTIVAILLVEPVYRFLWQFFPGFKFFRMPHRLLIFVILSLSVLSGIGIETVFKKKQILLKSIVIVLVTIDLFIFGIKYNPTYNVDKWFAKPETVKFLEKDTDMFRVLSLSSYESMYQYVKGWSRDTDIYCSYREMLYPDFNMLYHIPSFVGNGSILVKRTKEMYDILIGKYFSQQKEGVIIPLEGAKILGFQNVKYVLSLVNLAGEHFKLVKEINFYPRLPNIKLYENKEFVSRVIIVPKAKIATSEEEAKNMSFQDKESVILEKNTNYGSNSTKGSVMKIEKYENTEVIINAKITNDGFLVLNDTYYPGWKCFVDGKEEKILRANYLFRAVALKKGNHKVRFIYKPKSFEIGKNFTIMFLIITVFLLSATYYKNKIKRNTI